MSINSNPIINTVLLTATVFAALITSVANIVISIINNHRLKRIEAQRQLNDIDKYRYSRLYELLLNWNDYITECSGDTFGEIAFNRLFNLFLDNSSRYRMARVLLDKKHVSALDAKKIECEQLLSSLVAAEKEDGTHTDQFPNIRDAYFNASKDFDELLKNSINTQLETLLLRQYGKAE